MQKELDNEYWEKKDAKKVLGMSNISAVNNAVSITDIEQRMGLLEHIKNSDDLITHINGNRNRCKDWAYEGMDALGTPETQPKHIISDKDKEMGSATDKQRKACWAIIFGKTGKPELESELPDSIDHLSFEEASDFIEKYGRKS